MPNGKADNYSSKLIMAIVFAALLLGAVVYYNIKPLAKKNIQATNNANANVVNANLANVNTTISNGCAWRPADAAGNCKMVLMPGYYFDGEACQSFAGGGGGCSQPPFGISEAECLEACLGEDVTEDKVELFNGPVWRTCITDVDCRLVDRTMDSAICCSAPDCPGAEAQEKYSAVNLRSYNRLDSTFRVEAGCTKVICPEVQLACLENNSLPVQAKCIEGRCEKVTVQ